MVEQPNIKDVKHEFDRPEDAHSAPITPELVQKIDMVSNLLTIKMYNLHPWYETGRKIVADTTSETIYSRYVDIDYNLVLTHVSAANSLNTPTTIDISIERGGENVQLNRDVPSAADVSINWDGQVLLIEHDRVKVTDYGATAANIFTTSMSGYKIKA